MSEAPPQAQALVGYNTDPPEVQRLAALLLEALQPEVALNQALTSDEVSRLDTVQLSRQSYSLALVRLARYLWCEPLDMEEREAQAKVGLAYIRHAESTRLQALQIGRSIGDQQFKLQIAELRARLDKIAEAKANVLARKKGDGKSGAKAPTNRSAAD